MRRRLESASPTERSLLYDVLAEEAANGDADAAADLAWAVKRFRLARPALHTYLFKEQDVDAAEQRTLVAVALRIGSFRGEAKFTTWLHRVAINEAKQLVRGATRRARRELATPPEDLADHFVVRVSSMIADRRLIATAIEALPDNHRAALLLREEQGLAYSEIAEELAIPESTAKTWVRRARLELAEILATPTEDAV